MPNGKWQAVLLLAFLGVLPGANAVAQEAAPSPLFEAFQAYCVQTELNFSDIAAKADANGWGSLPAGTAASIGEAFDLAFADGRDSPDGEFRVFVGVQNVVYVSKVDQQERVSNDTPVCAVQGRRFDGASEAVRSWLRGLDNPTGQELQALGGQDQLMGYLVSDAGLRGIPMDGDINQLATEGRLRRIRVFHTRTGTIMMLSNLPPIPDQ